MSHPFASPSADPPTASLALLGLAMQSLPIGTWTAIGAAATFVCGMLFPGEPTSALRLGCVGSILAGVVGLQIAWTNQISPDPPPKP